MLELVAERVWECLRPLIVDGASCRAAIAYVGREAPGILPLALGDVIVLDGSDAALAAGTTDPEAVASWLGAGVQVQSLPGLHAKTILLTGETGRFAVVGSANVSAHSRDHLLEAAVVSDDPDLCEQVSEQLDRWSAIADDLDAAWITHARKVFRRDRGPRSKREPRRPQPSRTEPLWISVYYDDGAELSAAGQRAYEALQAQHGPDIVIWWWTLPPGEDTVVRRGQSVVLVRTNVDALEWPHGNAIAEPPALVIRVQPGHGDERPVAFLASDADMAPSKVRLAAVRRAVREAGGTLSLDEPLPRGNAANAVHDLWTAGA